MQTWGVTRAEDVAFEPVTADGVVGLTEATLIDRSGGAIHLEVSLGELAPGGSVAGHLHAHEESFYVLEGNALFSVADQSYELGPDSFGFAPVGTAHAWHNVSDAPVRWLRTRSPQPRRIGEANGVYPVADHPVPTAGSALRAEDRQRLHVGQYDDSIMPTPGALAMKGFRSPAPTNVAVWMLVDEVIGATHHTKFSVKFEPTEAAMTLGGQHFHPFEETYYITKGRAVAHLEDQSIEVGVGDLIFAGVNSLHGFTNPGTEAVRWIEMQAPNPPASGAFFFAGQWSTL